ncbi:hypothetical protein HAX54_014772, partial [Datura stramonium]|nr:hypothetical protein [Datura stramonium]
DHDINEEEVDYQPKVVDKPMDMAHVKGLEELAMLDEYYPLNKHAQQMCGMGITYDKPVDETLSHPSL